MYTAVWKGPSQGRMSKAMCDHAKLLVDSFFRVTGRQLVRDNEDLWNLDAVVASHGIQADPVLNYGNAKALEAWQCDWNTFTSTPSKYTAQKMERDERASLLREVHLNGFIDNYQGIRISTNGRRFKIVSAVVWNVVDENGVRLGQGATFKNFEML